MEPKDGWKCVSSLYYKNLLMKIYDDGYTGQIFNSDVFHGDVEYVAWNLCLDTGLDCDAQGLENTIEDCKIRCDAVYKVLSSDISKVKDYATLP
mgnify:CR=1 FL=1